MRKHRVSVGTACGMGLFLLSVACGRAPAPPAPPVASVAAQEEPVVTEVAPPPAQVAESAGPETIGDVFHVYLDAGDVANHFSPGGWMGDVGALEVDFNCTDSPFGGATCIKWTYHVDKRQQGWVGVVWQDPDKNWDGSAPNAGFDLTGMKKLVFAARGDKGGEVVTFGMGGLTGTYPDSGKKELKDVRLTREWKEYVVPLDGVDLKCIHNGFMFVVGTQSEVFYLDSIRYEK